MKPFRLLPSFREKIWGATMLEPWFPPTERRIGEVWFTFDGNQTDLGISLRDVMSAHGLELMGAAPASEPFPLLTKFIFTSERLSIQVHPGDDYARKHEGCPGKTEMWHVLRAGPGASIGIGFTETITRDRLRDAALSGEIETLLRWFPVTAGDSFLVPAGAVHAIGAGVAVCEIQQNSDVTYRLYDYGRPRELHVEKAMDVSDLGRHPGVASHVPLGGGRSLLARSKYFATELHDADAAFEYAPQGRMHILIAIGGSGTLGGCAIEPGHVWIVPAMAEPFPVEPQARLQLLDTYVP